MSRVTLFGGRRTAIIDGVDPAPRQIGQGGQVLRTRQHLRLVPAHGARQSRAILNRAPADQLAHHRIAAEPVGVVDILIAGQAREDRLAQQAGEAMAVILTGTRIAEMFHRQIDKAEGVVQFTV